jgi:uncharacterized integral membrane protein
MAVPTPKDGTEKGSFPGSVPPRAWVGLALLVVAVVFVAQNREPAEIQVLVFTLTAPLWSTLAAAVLVGLAVGVLLRPSERRRGRSAKR